MPEKTLATTGDIKSLIESKDFKSAVASALPAHLTPDRFVRIALTAITRIPKLAECDKQSIFQCLLLLSQFGLEPDGRNAHLIPFWNSKRNLTECQLIIDYKGLVDLAMRSGKVSYVHADKVCENDEFEYDKGMVKKHVVNFKEDRGAPYAYYAMVRNKDGSEKFEVMTLDEVKKIRQRSRAKESGPWVTDFDEMGKKTVFRRLSKWIQLSPEYREALEHDMDAFEELRFESAKPVIARPVIKKLKTHESAGEGETLGAKGESNGGDTQNLPGVTPAPEPPKKKSSSEEASSPSTSPRKLLKKKVPSEPERPNEAALISRLKVGGFTERQFVQIAKNNGWIRDPISALYQLDDKEIGQFVDDENWPTVQDELEKQPT